MQKPIFIILFLASLNVYGQKSEIEDLINQIANNEVPEDFEYYFLVPKSLEQPKIYDSLQNFQIKESGIPGLDFPLKLNDFPLNLIYSTSEEMTNWKNYDLKNVRYVSDEYIYQTSPPRSKTVRFVKYNIDQDEYDSLMQNKKSHTLLVRKKWFWNKNRIWDNPKFHNELVKAWKIDEEQNVEEKVYFHFSKPVFSKNKKYARVSVFKNKRCKGRGFTAIYEKQDNGIWKKIIEYNRLVSGVISSHIKCEEGIMINYK